MTGGSYRITAAEVPAPKLALADNLAMWGPPECGLLGTGYGARLHVAGATPGLETLGLLLQADLARQVARLARAIRQAANIPDDPDPQPAPVIPFPGRKNH